jgi:hypothetical protein
MARGRGGLWYAVLGFAVVACLAMTLNAFGEESLPRTPKLLRASTSGRSWSDLGGLLALVAGALPSERR